MYLSNACGESCRKGGDARAGDDVDDSDEFDEVAHGPQRALLLPPLPLVQRRDEQPSIADHPSLQIAGTSHSPFGHPPADRPCHDADQQAPGQAGDRPSGASPAVQQPAGALDGDAHVLHVGR